MKHTPAPWRVADDNVIIGADGTSVCEDGTGAFIAIANDADARLIAAAPDLLTALIDMVPIGPLGGYSPEMAKRIRKARSTIARAKGEQP